MNRFEVCPHKIHRWSRDFFTKIWDVDTRNSTTIALQASYSFDAFTPHLYDHFDVDVPEKIWRSVSSRQASFLAGRALASEGLSRLGCPYRQVRVGPGGAPVWPEGIAGSISHTSKKCFVLIVPSTDVTAGIDIEIISRGESLEAIQEYALSSRERDIVASQQYHDLPTMATLLFSAKESLFKALYPIVGYHFGFSAAEFSGFAGPGHLRFTLTGDLHSTLPAATQILVSYSLTAGEVWSWLTHKK